MLKNPVSIRLFGITQIAFLLAVAVALFLHWKRTKERKKEVGLTLDSVYIRDAIKRTPLKGPGAASTASASGAQGDSGAEPAPQLESALPTWTKETEAYEILGIPPSSDADTVEAAYRKLLKKYHPDRFASWGKGYQNRAHHVILLIQDARDRMLGKKKP